MLEIGISNNYVVFGKRHIEHAICSLILSGTPRLKLLNLGNCTPIVSISDLNKIIYAVNAEKLRCIVIPDRLWVSEDWMEEHHSRWPNMKLIRKNGLTIGLTIEKQAVYKRKF